MITHDGHAKIAYDGNYLVIYLLSKALTKVKAQR